MGTEIIAVEEMASSTLAPNSEAATILSTTADERELTDGQFALIARIADAPPPAPLLATDDDVRTLIGTMAGTLKAPRTSTDEGRLKLAVYKRMLGHLPLSTLQHVTHKAIATLEWMPTPAELLRLAEEHTAPERLLHAKAQALTRNRRQREFEETLRKAKDRTLTDEELQALSDHTARVAATQGSIIIRLDGSRVYRTKETIMADLKERMGERASLPPPDERDNRAGDVLSDGSGGTVGALAAGIMEGVEVSDEKA